MTNKWKYNKLKVKEGYRGERIIHAESGAYVGKVYPGSAEIVADIVANIAEGSDEIDEFLGNM